MERPGNQALKSRGIELRPLDLTGPQGPIVAAIKDLDVLISAVGAQDQLDQFPLVDAARTAGIKRFLPCAFMTVVPPKGVHNLRDK
jgi:hypothetical protein